MKTLLIMLLSISSVFANSDLYTMEEIRNMGQRLNQNLEQCIDSFYQHKVYDLKSGFEIDITRKSINASITCKLIHHTIAKNLDESNFYLALRIFESNACSENVKNQLIEDVKDTKQRFDLLLSTNQEDSKELKVIIQNRINANAILNNNIIKVCESVDSYMLDNIENLLDEEPTGIDL